jgi:hypothetical protein
MPPSNAPDAPARTAFSGLGKNPRIAIVARIQEALAVDRTTITDANLSEHAIQHEKRQFVLEDWVAAKRKRKSWIAEHGTFVIELLPGNNKGDAYWVCMLCGQVFAAMATTSAIAHLNNNSNDLHRLQGPNSKKLPPQSSSSSSEQGQRSVASLFASQAARANSGFILQTDLEIVERSISRWIVLGNYPFSIVESPDFQRALVVLSPEKTEKLFPKSATTTRKLVVQLYDEQLVIMKQLLATTPYKVHLSFDLWTSPNRMALLGIVGHFLDSNKKLQTRLLAMPRIFGQHSGGNQAKSMLAAIQDLCISDQVGFFQSDNVPSNGTAVSALINRLHPENSGRKTEQQTVLLRVRCFGHILNLAAKALFQGNDKKLLKTLAQGSEELETAEEEAALLARWRKRGPVGKLHNTVQFIRASPQRLDEFERLTRNLLTPEEAESFGEELFNPAIAGLTLKADNATRWNSVFFMIERACKFKTQIRIFCEGSLTKRDKDQRFPEADLLSTEDWVVLNQLLVVLEPIKRATKRFEGNWINFPEVFTTALRPTKKQN